MKTLKRTDIAVILLLMIAGAISTGCQTVNVKDTDGKPVWMAQVSSGPQGSKFAGSSVLTDAFGNAYIPIGDVESKDKWVAISKEGYISRRIPRPAEGKIEVVLKKIPSSGRRYTRARAVTSNGMSDTTRYRSTSPSQTTPGNNSRVDVPRKK